MALPSKEIFISGQEKIPVVEPLTTPEIKPETSPMEVVVGEEISLPQPITDEVNQVVLDNAAPQQVVVKLPLTEEQMGKALHLKIANSLRWLAEWTKRLLKIVGGRFIYKTT